MENVNILPNSVPKNPKGVVRGTGEFRLNWIPIFCANCGADGGKIPECTADFAFYLCEPCAAKYGAITNTYLEPDAVFWEKVKQVQLEEYGRELTAAEIEAALKQDDHPLTKLTKERKSFIKE